MRIRAFARWGQSSSGRLFSSGYSSSVRRSLRKPRYWIVLTQLAMSKNMNASAFSCGDIIVLVPHSVG